MSIIVIKVRQTQFSILAFPISLLDTDLTATMDYEQSQPIAKRPRTEEYLQQTREIPIDPSLRSASSSLYSSFQNSSNILPHDAAFAQHTCYTVSQVNYQLANVQEPHQSGLHWVTPQNSSLLVGSLSDLENLFDDSDDPNGSTELLNNDSDMEVDMVDQFAEDLDTSSDAPFTALVMDPSTASKDEVWEGLKDLILSLYLDYDWKLHQVKEAIEADDISMCFTFG
jgi:hypothetical protein